MVIIIIHNKLIKMYGVVVDIGTLQLFNQIVVSIRLYFFIEIMKTQYLKIE